jgi:hypothetical protein
MIYNRPLGGVNGAKKGALPGISTIYHYQYEFGEADDFVGMRVFFHEGIGCGKVYTAKDCESMSLHQEGLNEVTVGELRMATSTLPEGDVARERAAGQGARLVRGEEHKHFDAGVRLQKEVKKNDVKAQQEEAAKAAAARAVSESGVMLCRHCDKVFERQQCLRAHEDGCLEKQSSRASNRKTAVLRPASELAQDQVHSAASLSIGQGNSFRGQENKEIFFPKTIKFFPTPTDVPVVKEGWACKGASGVKGGAFKKSQRDFLLTLFNNNGGPKIRERDAQIKMVATFKDKDEDSDYSLRLVLSESQIKAWFSSESGRRKKAAVNRVFEKGFTELSQSIDLQDNQEGGHDLNGGVVEEGAPPPPPLPSPPPPPPPPPL